MPPVREASTKPTAATVLPAPVACSNQKRRLAPGSSGASSTCSSSSASCSSQSCGSSSSSASSSSSSSVDAVAAVLLGLGRRPVVAAPFARGALRGAVRALPLPLPLRVLELGVSAASVPESASTWWAESSAPSFRSGGSSSRTRSRPSNSE